MLWNNAWLCLGLCRCGTYTIILLNFESGLQLFPERKVYGMKLLNFNKISSFLDLLIGMDSLFFNSISLLFHSLIWFRFTM